ncbi:MAG: hypothetical protein A6F72_01980 [Cycloclasticus sp. symbiont of Poecilosclerida sp. N]|nr:MAG: hypothetical protein A6F72_01980 [Cycloclasticus sp. symbiont of Poecilosclerida sp. N]
MDFKVRRLSTNDTRPLFDCGDADLNEFFQKDSIESYRQLLAVTYAIEQNNELVAYFSVSNDAIKKESFPKSAFKRATSFIPHCKIYSSLPAVKIGRLATSKCKQSNGIGSEILNFIKGWFTEGNKTGCRFIIVDANNNPDTIGFYEKNGFLLLSQKDKSDDTRLLYFDLFNFRR